MRPVSRGRRPDMRRDSSSGIWPEPEPESGQNRVSPGRPVRSRWREEGGDTEVGATVTGGERRQSGPSLSAGSLASGPPSCLSLHLSGGRSQTDLSPAASRCSDCSRRLQVGIHPRAEPGRVPPATATAGRNGPIHGVTGQLPVLTVLRH